MRSRFAGSGRGDRPGDRVGAADPGHLEAESLRLSFSTGPEIAEPGTRARRPAALVAGRAGGRCGKRFGFGEEDRTPERAA